MPPETDPSLMQDFLVETGELVQQLDADLVNLETAPDGPQAKDLLSSIFRALHTIKGAAGFLGLSTVTAFAHAAEDAFNRLRKGEVAVSAQVMDVLLRSVDVLRLMVDDLSHGREAQACPAELIERLHAIASGPGVSAGAEAAKAGAAPSPAAQMPAPAPVTAARLNLDLPAQKLDLLSFMVADMRDTVTQLSQCLAQVANAASRADAAAHLAEIADALAKTAEFFDLASTRELAALLTAVSGRLTDVPDPALPALLTRLQSFGALIAEQATALEQKQAVIWPMQDYRDQVQALLDGSSASAAPGASQASADPETGDPAPGAFAPERREGERREGDRRVGDRRAGASGAAPGPEATIRVEISRLESLLNLVGQMVLNKNRMLGLGRRLRDHSLPLAMMEDIGSASNELDRLTSELQVAVMRTRMQPLTKLFERYPRVIRDMSRTLNKKINLELDGGDTEVDKSVLELLADPLVHLLRNSADHGIEAPEARSAAGKPAVGTIRLSAAHQGSHVRVEIRDDGKGIDAKAVAKKALEKGLTTAEKLATLSESEIYQFIFAPGLSTAEKVTDFSGRGVGMDVVRTNINKMNGVINVSSAPSRGTSIEILIPLTVAIMPAMVVGVGDQVYCVPLQSIREIVKPEPDAIHSVRAQPVMRLRDAILPLIDLQTRLDNTDSRPAGGAEGAGRFAVVVGIGAQAAGLRVDRLIGRQEIVIKPLDDKTTRGGPFSGATILEDGAVSLILDVVQLVRQASTAGRNPSLNAAKTAA